MLYALNCSLFGFKPTLLISETCRFDVFISTLGCFVRVGVGVFVFAIFGLAESYKAS